MLPHFFSLGLDVQKSDSLCALQDTIPLHYLANGGSPAPELMQCISCTFLNYRRVTNVHGTEDASVAPGAKVR